MPLSYRRNALTSATSNTDFLTPVRVVKAPSWILVGGIAIGMSAVVLWAATYRVPNYLSSEGVVLMPGSIRTVSCVAKGEVETILDTGTKVEKGKVVAEVLMREHDDDIETLRAEIDALQQQNVEHELQENQSVHALETQLNQIIVRRNETKKRSEDRAGSKTDPKNKITLRSLAKNAIKQVEKSVEAMEGGEQKDKIYQVIEGGSLFSAPEKFAITKQVYDSKAQYLEIQQQLSSLKKELDDLDGQVDELKYKIIVTRNSNLTKADIRQNTLLRKDREHRKLVGQKDKNSRLKAPFDGTVIRVYKAPGDPVKSSDEVFMIAANDEKNQLTCQAYFPVGAGSRIKVGDSALVTPSTHQSERHGSIRGTVTEVSTFPASDRSAMIKLGNKNITNRLLSKSNLKYVVIELESNAATRQEGAGIQYGWTGATPRGFDGLKLGMTAKVRVKIDEATPMELAFATMRKWIGQNDDLIAETSKR